MATVAALDQISLLTAEANAKLQPLNQAAASADILTATTVSGAIEGLEMDATLITDQLGIDTAQRFKDLAAAMAADVSGTTLAGLQAALTSAQNIQLQAEAGILAIGSIAKQAGAVVKAMLQANPPLGLALDANAGALAAKAQDLQLKGVLRQAATTANAAFKAVELAYAAVAIAVDPVAAKQQFLQASVQVLDAQTSLMMADQSMVSSQINLAAAELAALTAALSLPAGTAQTGVIAPQGTGAGLAAQTAIASPAPGQTTPATDPTPPASVIPVVLPATSQQTVVPVQAPAAEPVPTAAATTPPSGFSDLADRPTVWKGTELHQSMSFNLSDLSLLANKALGGRMRALSTLANNTVGSHADRSRAELGTIPVDTVVTEQEYGSGDDEFIRISGVNNYPGPGDISQGLNGEPTLGRLQLEGPDGATLPNERVVSNALINQGNANMPEKGGWNNLFMGAGQYIDHGQDLLNKGGQGSFKIPLPQDDDLFGKVPGNELQLLPRGTSVDTTPGQGRYMNTVTAAIDQNQLYGSDEILHGYLREKVAGEMTAKMLANKWSAPNADGSAGLPTFYDVLINNGADKESLDKVLNEPTYQLAHHALSAWDAKVRAGDSSVTGDPRRDGMTPYLEMISSSNQAFKVAAGAAWVDPNATLPGSNQQLLGDTSHLARYDAISLASHRIAGDLRVNENAQLSAFHNIFSNFHNNTVDAIEAALATLPDNAADIPGLEQLAAVRANLVSQEGQQAIFDMARMVLNAGYQRMVYDQYVVALAGGIGFGITAEQDRALMPDRDKLMPQPLSKNEHGFNGWQPEVRPSIGLEYSTSGFRVGHSQINENLDGLRVETVNEITTLNDRITQSLIQAFINPSALEALGGAAAVLAANASEHAQAIDTWMVGAVRNMLVGRPNDLGSFNLARNNELGLPTLNEFRQSLSTLLNSTGVANTLAANASDASVGLIDVDGRTNLLAERLRPYANWQEFKQNLRDPDQAEQFMQLYGGDQASLDNNIGLINVPLWLGGLAERPVVTPTGEGNIPSLMGSTFTFIVQETFDRAQDFDLWYYKLDLAGTDILKQISFQTFTPMLQTSLGKAAQFIHQDTFRTFVTDSLSPQTQSYAAPEIVKDASGLLVNRLILANNQANLVKGSDGSDDIRAGSGDDTVNGSGGKDWIYGQAGSDRLNGGDDRALDHIFGGDGNDLLFADDQSEDALFGENGNDILIRGKMAGMADGGLGHDVILGGKGDDTLYGDSGAANDTNDDGNDTIIGGQGDDLIIGGSGDDLLVGGDIATTGNLLIGDAKADANAELLVRAIRNENDEIIGTILPLFTELGYAVTVAGVNPQTGEQFSDQELSEFEHYIMDLRKVPNADHPGQRGPQPVMVVVPYSGKAGNDVIYTGNKSDVWQLLVNTYAGDPRLDALITSQEQISPAPESAQAENDGVTADTIAMELVHVTQEAIQQGDPDAQLKVVRARNQLVNATPTTQVFSGGGDDTIYTDGKTNTKIFAGAGYDSLKANTQSELQYLQVDHLGSDGATGMIINTSGNVDEFYSVEDLVLGDSGQNTLSLTSINTSLSLNFESAKAGVGVIIESNRSSHESLRISGIDSYNLGPSGDDRIVLSGKFDYDNRVDANRSDDNYKISWNGDSLTIDGIATGPSVFNGVEWVDFAYQQNDSAGSGIIKSFYYKEFAEKALNIGVELVNNPEFIGDRPDEVVIRRFGNEMERNRSLYLAVTAESLLDTSIDTIDFTVNLGHDFANIFKIDTANVQLSNDLAVQRHVQVIETPDGPSVRFVGAGLSALGAGNSISGKSVVAYVELQLRDDIDDILKNSRFADVNGFLNRDLFSDQLTVAVDANVDEVIFSDQRSLRDLGGQYAMASTALEMNVRAAQAVLNTDSQFDLGTTRYVTKPGEGGRSNLIRSGDTLFQATHWRNEGDFSLTDISLTDHSSDVAQVMSILSDGSSLLNQLSWNDSSEFSSTLSVNTWFQITGSAGSVFNTSDAGFSLDAYGGYSWDTREMGQFSSKNLITFSADLNYDGRVGMKDLAALNAGAAAGTHPHDVDANFDGLIDILDLAVLDSEWGQTLHTGVDDFIGSSAISMHELQSQGNHSWDSSAFLLQNAIESGSLQAGTDGHERAYVSPLGADGSTVSSLAMPMDVPPLITDQDQQFALTRT